MSAAAASPKKAKKVAKPALHPTFAVMVGEAIVGLKEKTGSSRQAIVKYVLANYKGVGDNANKFINAALKKGVASKKLKSAAVAGRKNSGKFKIGEVPKVVKKKKKVVKKKPAKKVKKAKKPAAKKAKKPAAKKAKKPAAKKPVAKKAAKKPAAKKPAAKKVVKKVVKKKAAKKAAPKKK